MVGVTRSRLFRIGVSCLLAFACGAIPAAAQKDAPRVTSGKEPPRVAPAPSKPVLKPPPPPPSKGTLLVVAQQVGATITVSRLNVRGGSAPAGRKAIGETGSCYFTLPPGRYSVTAEYPDYTSDTAMVSVGAGAIETVKPTLVAKFGFIVLAASNVPAGAKMYLDGRELPDRELDRRADGSVRIRTEPGKHSVRVERQGFTPFAREFDVIPAGGDDAVAAVAMDRVLASAVVRSEPGARVYVDGEQKGTIGSTGSLEVRGLAPDEPHDVRVELEEYQPFHQTVTASVGKAAEIDAPLVLLPTNGPFEDTFLDLSHWDAPPQWAADRGVLTVQGSPEIGVAKNVRYRDCEIVFSVRLLDPKGAAWLVHTRDRKNGYLFLLLGPGGRWPNQLRSYVARDGRYAADEPALALPILQKLQTRETYRVRIRVEGTTIQTWLTPSQTAEEISIGLFQDVDGAFPSGGVGFTTIDGAAFQVTGYVVKPLAPATHGR
jgi:hypothetical protein